MMMNAMIVLFPAGGKSDCDDVGDTFSCMYIDNNGDHDTSTSGRNDQSKQPARDDTQRAQLGSAGIIFQRYM